MKGRASAKSRIVTYEVTYYERHTTKTITKLIRGVRFDLSEQEENPLFYITDEYNQDAFCIPFAQLVTCIAVGCEKRSRAKRNTVSTNGQLQELPIRLKAK